MRVGLAVLGIVAVAGFLATVAVAPGLAAIAKLFPRQPAWRRRYYVDRTLKRLIRRGLVEEVQRGRMVGFSLTDRGREYLMRHELANAKLEQPKKWDGKWRLVVFDIQEKRRHVRDTIRTHLTRLGLSPIQKSVWLYPHPCGDLVRLLKVDLELGSNVQCFTFKGFEDREDEKLWRLRFDV